jgi:IS605 OrfB family transposase
MSRYRLQPSPAQETVLLRHCSDARYVWNLAVEQHGWWRPGRKSAPGYLEQSRQLTAARGENPWLAEGSQTVQQQALRDFAHAMRSFFNGSHRRPSWRKAGRDEGFRIVAVKPEHVRRLNRNHGAVLVPKSGWVRFPLSRPVPAGVKSFRVTRDRAGRWHVAFAHAPDPVGGPATGEVVGIDRGVTVTLALSDGTMLQAPQPKPTRALARRLSRARRGSSRRRKAKLALARARARNADALNDWAHKTSTGIARRYDVIRIEDLKIRNMTRSARGTIDAPGRNVAAKAGLNRSILQQGWGLFARCLEYKAPGRVEKINPAYTSQTCSQCKTRDREARESQAVFRCRACGYWGNADVNAARNIAAGHAVKARGGDRTAGPVSREPQRELLLVS